FAQQYQGQAFINPYAPTGPNLITFGPYDLSGTTPESGSISIAYAAGSGCPHGGFSYVVLIGDVYIGSDFAEPATEDHTKACDRKNGGDAGDGGNGCSSCSGPPVARYSAHAMLASLNIEDTPIRYAPPKGPAINFNVTYNQRDAQQPQTFNYSNLGPKWTFNWLSYVTDDPNNASANATVYVPGGGSEAYLGFDLGSQSYLPDPQSHTVLVRTAPDSYEKR